jgi:hypothetical protein
MPAPSDLTAIPGRSSLPFRVPVGLGVDRGDPAPGLSSLPTDIPRWDWARDGPTLETLMAFQGFPGPDLGIFPPRSSNCLDCHLRAVVIGCAHRMLVAAKSAHPRPPSPTRISGLRKRIFMAEMAGSRLHVAWTNPSPSRNPAYPCNWILYDRDRGEVIVTVVRESGRGSGVRLERVEHAKPA